MDRVMFIFIFFRFPHFFKECLKKLFKSSFKRPLKRPLKQLLKQLLKQPFQWPSVSGLFLFSGLLFPVHGVRAAPPEIKPYCWAVLEKNKPPQALDNNLGDKRTLGFDPALNVHASPLSKQWNKEGPRTSHNPLLLRTFYGHTGAFQTLDFYPHQKRLVTAANDLMARVWGLDSPTPLPLFLLVGHSDVLTSALVTRDGRWIVTGAMDGKAKLWNAENGRFVVDLLTLHHSGRVVVRSVSQGGRFVAIETEDEKSADVTKKNALHLFDLKMGKVSLKLEQRWPFDQVQFTSGGRFLFVSNEKEARFNIYDRDNKWKKFSFKSNNIEIDRFTAKNWFPFYSSVDKDTLNVFALGKKAMDVKLKKVGEVSRFIASNNHRWIATWNRAGPEPAVVIWNVESGQRIRLFKDPNNDLLDVQFGPNGNTILMLDTTGAVKIWNVHTGNLQGEIRGHTGPIIQAYYTPDSDGVLTLGIDRQIKVWQIRKTIY